MLWQLLCLFYTHKLYLFCINQLAFWIIVNWDSICILGTVICMLALSQGGRAWWVVHGMWFEQNEPVKHESSYKTLAMIGELTVLHGTWSACFEDCDLRIHWNLSWKPRNRWFMDQSEHRVLSWLRLCVCSTSITL